MAVIRTPTGFVDDTGTPLQMAKTDVPANQPNVGAGIIAGAPAATLTNPTAAVAQPPPAPVPNTPSTYQPGSGPPASASLPTPPIPSTGMRASPDQAPVPASVARSPTQRGPTSGVSSPVDEALIRAKADAAVQADQGNADVKSPTALVLDYLTKQGLPRTSDNVRRALEANARDPSTIQGLINQAPPAATAIDTRPNSGGGAARRGPPTAAPPTTPATPANQGPPGVNTGGGLTPGQIAALALGGAAGGGAAYWLARRNASGNAPGAAGEAVATPAENLAAEYVGRQPLQPNGRVIDIPPTALQSPGTRALPSPVSAAIDDAVRPATGPDNIPEVHVTAPTDAGNIRFRGPRSAATAAEAAELARQAAAARSAARGARFMVR